MEILLAFGLVSAVFMGVSIGASTVASSFGPVNSAGSANVFRSALLAGAFALLGAVTQGGNVTETVGKGILQSEMLVSQSVIILLVAATLVIVSVLTDYPMPTAFTVIGAVVGAGIGFGNGVQWASLQRIVGFWLLVPFLAVAMGYGFAKIMRATIPRDEADKVRILLLISGSYVAYSAGASAVGLAVGPLTGFSLSTGSLLLVGGFSILAGSWMYSPRIIRAISFDYSSIGPRRSVAALGTAAILAQVGIIYGIPISFNEAIIASVIGSGMVSESSEVDKGKIGRTVLAWTGAFLLAAVLTFVAGLLLT